MAVHDDDHQHSWPGEFVFCPMCGSRLGSVTAGGRQRMGCSECGFVHYRNPGVGAAVVIRDDAGRLLMVRRGPEASRSGLWAIPAGFVDYGEDIRDAARRELREETGLEAELGPVVHVASNFHDPEKLTVGVWFSGTVTGGELQAGDDVDDVAFFALSDLPPLAFDTDAELLRGLGADGAASAG